MKQIKITPFPKDGKSRHFPALLTSYHEAEEQNKTFHVEIEMELKSMNEFKDRYVETFGDGLDHLYVAKYNMEQIANLEQNNDDWKLFSSSNDYEGFEKYFESENKKWNETIKNFNDSLDGNVTKYVERILKHIYGNELFWVNITLVLTSGHSTLGGFHHLDHPLMVTLCLCLGEIHITTGITSLLMGGDGTMILL